MHVQFLLMKIIQSALQAIKDIPKPIRVFASKALLLLVIWQVIYLGLLAPKRIIDQPLSMFTGKATAWCVKYLMPSHSIVVKEVLQKEKVEAMEFDYLKTTIFADGIKLIGIADGCNGLSLFMLFIGFIIAYPAPILLKLRYGVLGLILIVLVNILRCTGLAMFSYYNPKVLFFAHHYLFKVMVYGIVFFLWVRFTQINQKHNQHA